MDKSFMIFPTGLLAQAWLGAQALAGVISTGHYSPATGTLGVSIVSCRVTHLDWLDKFEKEALTAGYILLPEMALNQQLPTEIVNHASLSPLGLASTDKTYDFATKAFKATSWNPLHPTRYS